MNYNNIPQEILKNLHSKNKNQKESNDFCKNYAIKFLQEKGLLLNEENLEIIFSSSYLSTINSFFKNKHNTSFANGTTIVPKYFKDTITDYYSNSDKHFIVINTEIPEIINNKVFLKATIVHELVHHIDFSYYDINEQKFEIYKDLFLFFSEYRAKYYQELFLIEKKQYNKSHTPIKECQKLLSKEIDINKDIHNILYNIFQGVGYVIAHNNISSFGIPSRNLKVEHRKNINSLKKIEPDNKKGSMDNLITFLNELFDKDEIQDINFLEKFIN